MVAMTGAGAERRAWRSVAVPVTSVRDGFEHLVAEKPIALGNTGRYVALCGRIVWAAALASPAGPRCPACVAVHSVDAVHGPRHRRASRRGAWARLVGLLCRPRPARSKPPQSAEITLPPTGAVPSSLCHSVRQ